MNEYFANAVAMFDPDTKKMSEYKLGLKWGIPYEGVIDHNGMIWLEDAQYQSIVRFDTQTKKSTYYPYPQMKAHAPKMEVDAEGTVWSGISGRGQPGQLTAFKPKGNVPMRSGTLTSQK